MNTKEKLVALLTLFLVGYLGRFHIDKDALAVITKLVKDAPND